MLKKTITYEDWNGKTRTEDFYFNLTKVECAELEYGLGPGHTLTETFQILSDTNDIGQAIKIIKEVLLKSYGVKSDDGRRFMKSPEIRKSLEENPVFDELYIELASDAGKAADFFTALLPKDIQTKLGDNPSKAVLDKMQNGLSLA